MNKFLTIVKMAISDAIIYRVDLIIYVFGGIVRPLVFLSLWLGALYSGGKTPLSSSQFVNYYLLAMLIGTFVNAWSAPFLSAKIRTGRLSPFLLRPFPYILFDLANNIGEKIFKYVYLIPIVVVFGILFQAKIPSLNLINALVLIPSLLLAFAINYLMDIGVGISAFWTDESSAIRDTNDLLSYIFSGWIIPLVLLPGSLRAVAYYLPYRYTLSFPIEIIMGTLPQEEILKGLFIGLIWLALIAFILKKEWQRGLKIYSSVGA